MNMSFVGLFKRKAWSIVIPVQCKHFRFSNFWTFLHLSCSFPVSSVSFQCFMCFQVGLPANRMRFELCFLEYIVCVWLCFASLLPLPSPLCLTQPLISGTFTLPHYLTMLIGVDLDLYWTRCHQEQHKSFGLCIKCGNRTSLAADILSEQKTSVLLRWGAMMLQWLTKNNSITC